jgi:hypothetical protein
MFNADAEPATLLPELSGSGRWRVAIDTAQPTTMSDGEEPQTGEETGRGTRSAGAPAPFW